jgi:aryl-alcohol dehydrogenase-like predicted oxidoreductase
MFAGLTSTYNWIALFGKDGKPHAARDVYADFLDEASAVLNKPALKDAAQKFRDVTLLWATLAHDLLPDRIEPFKETRDLITRKHISFLEKGGAALDEIVAINERLDAIKADVAVNFPLDAAEVTAHLECMREDLLKIRDSEYEAVMTLQDSMA